MNDDKTTGLDEITRRQWLLVLGRLAAVSGFSGIAPELARTLYGEEVHTAALPPGLYRPSTEHLSHVLTELGSLRAIPPGSETEYVEPGSSPFKPQFFSDEEFRIVTRFAEILLGNVEPAALSQAVRWLDLYLYSAAGVREAALNLDPHHRALAVAYYGETSVRDLETADPQDTARSGLASMQQLSHEKYEKDFLHIDVSQQRDLIHTLSGDEPSNPLGKLFEIIRAEAVRGYYTSAQGLEELDYKGNWYYATCPECDNKSHS